MAFYECNGGNDTDLLVCTMSDTVVFSGSKEIEFDELEKILGVIELGAGQYCWVGKNNYPLTIVDNKIILALRNNWNDSTSSDELFIKVLGIKKEI